MSTQNKAKDSVEKRLASYGAMSLAVACGFVSTPASGSVLFTDTSGWAGNSTTSGAVFFNPSTQAFGTSSANEAFKLSHIPSNTSSGSVLVMRGLTASNGGANSAGNFLRKFNASSQVSTAGASFVGIGRLEASSAGVHHGNFNPGDVGFIGLKEGSNYGWAKVQIESGYHTKLLGFAIQTTSGVPITGNEAPEPSSMILLALGAAGIAAYRRMTTAKLETAK